MNVVVIGGVAAGTKTAAKLMRQDRSAKVTVYTKSKDISYAGCGLPYYVGGSIESRDELIVNTPAKYTGLTGVEVKTEMEAVGVDAAAKELDITVDMKYAYGNQFYGDADITAVMDTWYQGGTEIVFACGGGIWTSAAEAAKKTGGKVIGVDTDQSPVIDAAYGEGMTITSAMKGLAPTTIDTLTDIVINGNWANYAGKIQTLGLVSADPEANYVQIPMTTTQFEDGKFTSDDYAALVAGMFDGTIKVSNDITAEPAVEASNVEYLGNLK